MKTIQRFYFEIMDRFPSLVKYSQKPLPSTDFINNIIFKKIADQIDKSKSTTAKQTI